MATASSGNPLCRIHWPRPFFQIYNLWQKWHFGHFSGFFHYRHGPPIITQKLNPSYLMGADINRSITKASSIRSGQGPESTVRSSRLNLSSKHFPGCFQSRLACAFDWGTWQAPCHVLYEQSCKLLSQTVTPLLLLRRGERRSSEDRLSLLGRDVGCHGQVCNSLRLVYISSRCRGPAPLRLSVVCLCALRFWRWRPLLR